jgi:alkylation response protein AidB-like acyl-CoA dehydrogenase
MTVADEAYRGQLGDALKAFDRDVVCGWDEAGHVPATALAHLGAAGVFRDRWQDGAEQGADLVVAMAEQTSTVSAGLALAVMAQSEVFCGALHWLATSEPQRDLLDAALRGAAIGCLASTEPGGGSALAGIQTSARREGPDWRVQGCKRYISNLGGSTHVLVLARPGDHLDARDLSLFVVPLDRPGVSIDGFFPAMGLSACDVGQLTLDTVVPASALLGSPGMGLAYLSRLLQFERLSICAQLLTGARAALGLAASFARSRMVGAERLMDKQAVRHQLARCQAQLWTIEAALHDLATRTRAGEGTGRQTAALKLEASRVAEQVTDTSMQVFGARGYTSHYPVERIWRDVRLARIGGGTDEVLAELVGSGLDRRDPGWDEQLSEFEAADLPQPQVSSAKILRPPAASSPDV